MTRYIGELHTRKPFIIEKQDDGSHFFTTEDKTISFTCDEQELSLIKNIINITPERKPYSRAVLRNKLLSACPSMGNDARAIMYTVMSSSKRVPTKALIHTSLYIPAKEYKRLVMLLSKAMRDNMLGYVCIYNKELDCNFLNEEIFLKALEKNGSIEHLINRNVTITVKLGFNSLKLFSYMSLNGIKCPSTFDVDYSVYLDSNTLINQINDELEGTY